MGQMRVEIGTERVVDGREVEQYIYYISWKKIYRIWQDNSIHKWKQLKLLHILS